MRYFIKNVTSTECRNIVIKHLEDFSISYNWIGSGIVELVEKISTDKESSLMEELGKSGFVLQRNKKSVLIQDIKLIVAKTISSQSSQDEFSNNNFSFYLSEQLGYHYTYLANIFSDEQGITIKQYIISQKVEIIKNMILNESLRLKQIASLMQYKSVSHLSNQFKKITGMSPSHFKKTTTLK